MLIIIFFLFRLLKRNMTSQNSDENATEEKPNKEEVQQVDEVKNKSLPEKTTRQAQKSVRTNGSG